MNKNIKKYQFWFYSDSGYHLKEFDDLNELPDLISEAYTSNFYITHKIDINIDEVKND